MASVYVEMTRISAAQYRLDKTKLIIALEGLFLRTTKQTNSERWLHIIAPVHHDLWEPLAYNESIELKNHIDAATTKIQKQFQQEIGELKAQVEENIKQSTKISKFIDEKGNGMLRKTSKSSFVLPIVENSINQKSLPVEESTEI